MSIKQCCVYQMRQDSKHLFVDAYISEYVYLYHFAHCPLTSQQYVVYGHIFLDDLTPISRIDTFRILTPPEFSEHFALYMEMEEVNKKIKGGKS